jgi:hypothetical protein
MNWFPAPFEITEEGICIPFLFWSKTILYKDIKSVRKVPLWKAFLEGMNPLRPPMVSFSSPAFSVVLIETKKNQYFAVYPRDGEKFVRLVSSRMTNSN